MRRAIGGGGGGRAIAIRALVGRPTDHATDHDAGVSIAHIGRAGGRDSARGDSHRPIDCRGGVVGLARLELLGRVKTWRR